jgi:uncharacterized protein DUF6794
MTEVDPRRALRISAGALLVVALVRLIAIRYELPPAVPFALVVVALGLTLAIGIYLTRVVNQWHTHRTRFNRPLMSGRFRGVMTSFVICILLFVSGRLVLPRSWPTSIEGAVTTLEATLDADARQRLAELGPYDLRFLHSTMGAWIAEHFGLAHGNYRLHADCGFGDYIDPDSCTSLVIETLWKKLRAELPAQQRAALEVLEARMEAVVVPPFDFRRTPLEEVGRFFNRNISQRLTDASMFEVMVAPKDAQSEVTWRETSAVSLSVTIMRLSAETDIDVRKAPPNLVMGRDPER